LSRLINNKLLLSTLPCSFSLFLLSIHSFISFHFISFIHSFIHSPSSFFSHHPSSSIIIVIITHHHSLFFPSSSSFPLHSPLISVFIFICFFLCSPFLHSHHLHIHTLPHSVISTFGPPFSLPPHSTSTPDTAFFTASPEPIADSPPPSNVLCKYLSHLLLLIFYCA
jgi:hypothetical protein